MCRTSSDESNEDGTVIFNDCNANVEYARRFMDEFVLNMQKESNNSCHRLSWKNGIYGYSVRTISCKIWEGKGGETTLKQFRSIARIFKVGFLLAKLISTSHLLNIFTTKIS